MFIADIRRCDLNDLFYFAMVVEHGGFSQAGRALAMPKSKLSRRIALLEERLGVRLIQRSTRRFSVTEVGQDYYRHCKAMLVEAEAAEEAIAMSRAEPRGTIRLACPIAILHARIGPMLADFLAPAPAGDGAAGRHQPPRGRGGRGRGCGDPGTAAAAGGQ